MGSHLNPALFTAQEVQHQEMAVCMQAMLPLLLPVLDSACVVEVAFTHTGKYVFLTVMHPMQPLAIQQVNDVLDQTLFTMVPKAASGEGEGGGKGESESDGCHGPRQTASFLTNGRELIEHFCFLGLQNHHPQGLLDASADKPLKGIISLQAQQFSLQLQMVVHHTRSTKHGRDKRGLPENDGMISAPTLH